MPVITILAVSPMPNSLPLGDPESYTPFMNRCLFYREFSVVATKNLVQSFGDQGK